VRTLDFSRKPVIACVHLLSTPGAPAYEGNVEQIYDEAVSEARAFVRHGVDGLIIENFRDGPFFPDAVPAETIATIASVAREVIRAVPVPVGIAVLRNDAEAAMAVAAATNASFVRVNVHIGAVLAEQGIVVGMSHKTLRLREALKCRAAIFADAGVKHSRPLTYPDLAPEIRDLAPRADAIIISGSRTGEETAEADLDVARAGTKKPLLIGSGVTPANLPVFHSRADGFIVGSFFKEHGLASNRVDERRVRAFMDTARSMRG
jgi:uncharacterized protein